MKKKDETSTGYEQTRQQRFPAAEDELDFTNAIPRCTKFDLIPGEHRHHESTNPSQDLEYTREKECTYTTSLERGNCVTEGKNY